MGERESPIPPPSVFTPKLAQWIRGHLLWKLDVENTRNKRNEALFGSGPSHPRLASVGMITSYHDQQLDTDEHILCVQQKNCVGLLLRCQCSRHDDCHLDLTHPRTGFHPRIIMLIGEANWPICTEKGNGINGLESTTRVLPGRL